MGAFPANQVKKFIDYKSMISEKKENSCEKISFGELIIEKVKLFTQNSIKTFCISVFNVEGSLASCLTFRTFLMLDPSPSNLTLSFIFNYSCNF